MAKGTEDIRVNQGEIEQRRTPGFSVRDQRGKYAMDKENRRIWFRAATVGEKSDGVDILSSAWKKDIKTYMRDNPVMGDRHNYDGDSNGQAVNYEIDELGLMLQMQFATSARAEELWGLYSNGDQRAVSVGWDTVEYRMEQRGEDDERKHEVYVVTRARLLELSTCLVGLDSAAVSSLRDMPATDGRLELAYRSAFAKEETEDELEIHEKPDRIAEVIERLERIENVVSHLPYHVSDAVGDRGAHIEKIPIVIPPKPIVPDEIRKLAEVNSDLTGEALRDRLKLIRTE